jgi:hypothetical protein
VYENCDRITAESTETTMNSALVGLLLFSTTLALGQSKDVNGWDKIKWGMTLEQAAAAYNIEYKPETNEYWTILDLPSITVAGINLEVNCGAKHGTDTITLVRMSDFRNPLGIPAKPNAESGMNPNGIPV